MARSVSASLLALLALVGAAPIADKAADTLQTSAADKAHATHAKHTAKSQSKSADHTAFHPTRVTADAKKHTVQGKQYIGWCDTAWEDYCCGAVATCTPCNTADDCSGGADCYGSAYCTETQFCGSDCTPPDAPPPPAPTTYIGWCDTAYDDYCCGKVAECYQCNTADDCAPGVDCYGSAYCKEGVNCGSDDCVAPSPAPPPPPLPPGAVLTTTSRFGAGGTAVAGANTGCGGGTLELVSETLATLGAIAVDGFETSMPVFGVAPAQSMYQVKDTVYDVAGDPDGYENCGDEKYAAPCGCCPSQAGSVAAADFDGVLHLGCGDCVVFHGSSTTPSWSDEDKGIKPGALMLAVVVDTCPHFQNQDLCPADGQENERGFLNHLDVLHSGADDLTGADISSSQRILDAIGDQPFGSIQKVDCPASVVSALTTAGGDQAKLLCTNFCPEGQPCYGCPGFEKFGCGVSESQADCAASTSSVHERAERGVSKDFLKLMKASGHPDKMGMGAHYTHLKKRKHAKK